MKRKSSYNLTRKKGITLIEIMCALLILAFAFLPIIGVIGGSAKETDVANSIVFAQTTARNILNALLDDVPFNSIREGSGSDNIAKLYDYGSYRIDSFQSMIGATSEIAQGNIMDERGTNYAITIYCYPIEVNKGEIDVANEIAFSYLPRPNYEGSSDSEIASWYTYKKDSKSAYIQNSIDPYTMAVATTTLGAYSLGARPNKDTSEYYVMKKILFKMSWKNRDGKERTLDLYTMKANLDSEVGI